MSDTPSNEKVRISSAADLFEVLTDGSLEAQIGVLQSVVQEPTRPLSLGKHQGEDFIDLLIRLFPQRGSGLSQLYLMCLSCYQDPRTTAFMVDARWQVRAATTEVLACRADCPVEEIRVKVGSEHLRERIAALDVLRRIGDDEWLEVYLESQLNQGPSIRAC